MDDELDDELELKPCAHCGGEAIFNEIEAGANAGGHFVECVKCGICTGLVFACGDDPQPILAERWNRRVKTTTKD